MFEAHLESRRTEDLEQEFSALEGGWYVGAEQFRQELLEQVHTRPGPSHYGQAVHEAVEIRAERLIAEALKSLGWTEQELLSRPKGQP